LFLQAATAPAYTTHLLKSRAVYDRFKQSRLLINNRETKHSYSCIGCAAVAWLLRVSSWHWPATIVAHHAAHGNFRCWSKLLLLLLLLLLLHVVLLLT
jgi:hypothetical protein